MPKLSENIHDHSQNSVVDICKYIYICAHFLFHSSVCVSCYKHQSVWDPKCSIGKQLLMSIYTSTIKWTYIPFGILVFP